MIIRLIQPAEFPGLIDFIVPLCRHPQTQCINSWAGDDKATLLQDFKKMDADNELLYLGAFNDGRMVGTLGCEFDEDLGRGWLHGPHLVITNEVSDAIDLYIHLLNQLPESINQLDAYPNLANAFLHRFYTQMGFKERLAPSNNYNLSRNAFIPNPDSLVIRELTGNLSGSFIHLYESTFPGSPYSAQRLISSANGQFKIYLTTMDDSVTGFVVASHSTDHSHGKIEFLGVDQHFCRRGIGTALLNRGLRWLFADQNTQSVSLSVFSNLDGARRLYENQGFT
ncbi:MAG: GNAT family N-acetyltransferase [Candidatus Neomarinimicrobiota bacterium]